MVISLSLCVSLSSMWISSAFILCILSAGLIGVVDRRLVELELYLLILVDSGSAGTAELAGGLVSVASLATRAFIIGALFDLLSDPRPPSSVLPFVTLSKSLLLYGAMPWPWMGVELMFALTGGSTSIFLSTMPSYEILSSNC